MNEALSDELHDLQELIDHPGWQRLIAFQQGQKEVRVAEMLLPLPSLEAALPQQFYSGEISGMSTLVGWPLLRVEQIRETLKRWQENEDEHGNSGYASGSGNDSGPGEPDLDVAARNFAAAAGIDIS